MRVATQAINMLWVLALAALRGALAEFGPAHLPASIISFGGLTVISIAAHRLRRQFNHDAWFGARWATLSGELREFWARIRAFALTTQAWPRICPPVPSFILASAAVAGASLLRWRLRAPEAAAALAQRVQRLLRQAPSFDIDALRNWLSDWLPGWDPASGLRREHLPLRHGFVPAAYRPTLFAPLSLPQRC